MKRLVISLGVIMTVVLVGLTACQGGETATQQQPVTVTRGDLTVSINGSGFIETSNEAKLSFGTGGKIKEITVDEGDEVKKGQVLARLDTSPLELALTQAQVALAQAQLTQQSTEYELKLIKDKKDPLDLAVFNAQIGLKTAEYNLGKAQETYTWPDLETAQSDVDGAESRVEYYSLKLSEATNTNEQETYTTALIFAKQQLADAEAKLDAIHQAVDTEEVEIKRMQVTAAEMTLSQAQKAVNDISNEIAIKELQLNYTKEAVALAQKSVDEVKRQLSEATITAPFDGAIAKVFVEEGDTISPVNTIIHIIDPTAMELGIQLDEIDVPQVKPGQETVITLDALPGKKFSGKVSNIFPLPNVVGGVVLYDVKINFDVPKDAGIKVGMSASADVIIEKRTGVLLVPNRAVTQDKQGKTIVKVKSGEQVTERPVITGVTDDVSTEIVSGVTEGETVVIESRPKATTPSIM
jgi:HlyD family secretion protein